MQRHSSRGRPVGVIEFVVVIVGPIHRDNNRATLCRLASRQVAQHQVVRMAPIEEEEAAAAESRRTATAGHCRLRSEQLSAKRKLVLKVAPEGQKAGGGRSRQILFVLLSFNQAIWKRQQCEDSAARRVFPS